MVTDDAPDCAPVMREGRYEDGDDATAETPKLSRLGLHPDV